MYPLTQICPAMLHYFFEELRPLEQLEWLNLDKKVVRVHFRQSRVALWIFKIGPTFRLKSARIPRCAQAICVT